MSRDQLNALRQAIQIAANSNQIDQQVLNDAALALGMLIARSRRAGFFDVQSMMPRTTQN